MARQLTVLIYPTLMENILEHSESMLCYAPWTEMKGAIPLDLPGVTFLFCPWDAAIGEYYLHERLI